MAESNNNDPRWDSKLWATSQAVDACMKLGGVILKPPTDKPPGFWTDPEPKSERQS